MRTKLTVLLSVVALGAAILAPALPAPPASAVPVAGTSCEVFPRTTSGT